MAEEVRLDTPSTARESSGRQSDSSEQRQPDDADCPKRIEKDELAAPPERTQTRAKEIWKLRLRPADDDEPQ